jgi:enoyl-CoA hydratase/carnithine racemase
MQYDNILFEVNDGVATITLNRPESRNVITGAEIIDELEAAFATVNADMSIMALIITGADPAFSAGGNVKEMAQKTGMFAGTPAEIEQKYKQYVQRIPLAVQGVEVPTIAAVNGPAIGAGCDFALMCDMRVASEKARFGETFLNVGLIPGDGGAWFLPRVVGMARACELTFTGDVIDGETAFQIGLVNYVVPHDRLLAKTNELAAKIAAKPPVALRMAKKLLYMGRQASLQELLDQSAAYQGECHNTEDHLEALAAMFEKRAPRFKGR